MLSIETEARVAKLFLNVADGEKSAEINRQVLSEQFEFDAYQIFKKLDYQSKNKIDEFDIVDFLKLNSVYCSYNEARFIIFFYDSDGDGRLNYSEFINLILSEYNYTLRRISRERIGISSRQGHHVPYDVEYSLCKLFEKEIDLVRNLELILENVKSRYDFNVDDLFSSMEAYTSLRADNVRRFLVRNGVDANSSDVNAILRRLDIDKDSLISYSEFQRLFTFPIKGSSFENTSHSIHSSLPLKSTLNSAKSTLRKYETDSAVRRYVSPRRYYSPIRLDSPLRNTYRSSRFTLRNSNQTSPSGSLERNQRRVRSPLRLRSPPLRVASPLRVRSPLRSTNQQPIENFRNSDDLYHNTSNSLNLKPYSIISSSGSLEEEKFQDYLKEIIKIENEIERTKCDLVLRSDFNFEDAFRVFELDGRGYLTDLDLKFGFNSFDLYPANEEIKLLIRRFDLKSEGVLTYEAFVNLVSPIDSEYRRMLENRLPSPYELRYNKVDVFLPTTKLYIQNLINLIIKSEVKLEGLRQKLNRMTRFNINSLYGKIDRYDKGFISETDIRHYFKLNDINYLTLDIDLLMERLDRDKDGRINYLEYSYEFYPRSVEYFA